MIDYLKMSHISDFAFSARKLGNKRIVIGVIGLVITSEVSLSFSLTDALRDECKWDGPISQPRCGIRSRVTGKLFNLWTV